MRKSLRTKEVVIEMPIKIKAETLSIALGGCEFTIAYHLEKERKGKTLSCKELELVGLMVKARKDIQELMAQCSKVNELITMKAHVV